MFREETMFQIKDLTTELDRIRFKRFVFLYSRMQGVDLCINASIIMKIHAHMLRLKMEEIKL